MNHCIFLKALPGFLYKIVSSYFGFLEYMLFYVCDNTPTQFCNLFVIFFSSTQWYLGKQVICPLCSQLSFWHVQQDSIRWSVNVACEWMSFSGELCKLKRGYRLLILSFQKPGSRKIIKRCKRMWGVKSSAKDIPSNFERDCLETGWHHGHSLPCLVFWEWGRIWGGEWMERVCEEVVIITVA